jgi:hypothetical protein
MAAPTARACILGGRLAGLAVLALIAAWGLSACGGGDTAPQPTYSHYEATERDASRTGSAQTVRTLNVVDMDTGTVVRQYTLSSQNGPPDSNGQQGPDWLTTPRLVRSADGLRSTYYGAGLLHFIQNGQVMQLDLSSPTLGEARPVSINKACWFRGDATPFNADASQFWLTVYTAGYTGDCHTAPDNHDQLLATDMSASAGTLLIEQKKELIDTLYDAQGQVIGLLAVDRTLMSPSTPVTLGVWRPDLQTRLQSLSPSPAVRISGRPTVRRIANLPTDARLSLLQIGQQVHLLDWRSGQAVLSPALFTSTDVIDPAVITRDTQHVYMADGCTIRRIDGVGTVSEVATLPGDVGHIVELASTPSKLVAVQAQRVIGYPYTGSSQLCNNATAELKTKVRTIDKATLAISQLAGTDTPIWMRLLGSVGEQVFLATPGPTFNIDTVNIDRLDATGLSPSVHIIDKVQLLGLARPLKQGPGLDSQNAQLWWCTLGAWSDCRGGQLVRHSLATGVTQALGALPDRAPDGVTGSFDFRISALAPDRSGLWADKPGLLLVDTDYTVGSTSYLDRTPWWLGPASVKPLREAMPAP